MTFERQVRKELKTLLAHRDSQIIIDSTRVVASDEDSAVTVSYHLEGQLASPVQFTFLFLESVPLEESLDAFPDYGSRNWQTAHFAPGEVPPRNQFAAGAD